MSSSQTTFPPTVMGWQSSTAAISNQRKRPGWSDRLAVPYQCALLALLMVLPSALPRAPVAQAALITVNVLTDNAGGSCPGSCSLRAALAAANAGDEVQFSVTGTIVLSQGELVADKDVTITGPGASSLALDGNDASRVLRVNSGVTATLSGLTIQHGNPGFVFGEPGGGGIYNEGTLTVTNSTLSGNNRAFDFVSGSGIFNVGTLTLTNSTLSGNGNDFGAGDGGGIYNAGELTVTNSTVSDNISDGVGGGILNGGAATVTNSNISGNFSDGGVGGGIANFGTLTLTNSDVGGNAASFAIGGGIYNGGKLTVTNSKVGGNSANPGYGGGIYNDGELTVTNSTLSRNFADIDGGGIANFGTLTLTNSTISGNSANVGGGIANFSRLNLTNGTLSNNDASVGGGISNSGRVTLANSIVANSLSGGNCDGSPITSQGDNLSSDATCVSTDPALHDRNNTDPLLDPDGLQDNGGPTPTIALQPTSPAVDGVLHNACPPPTTDQRGVSRPVGVRCDIGAVELSARLTTVALDIKPGSTRNPLNPQSHGVIPVAILTTATFDAATVDPSTVRFGASGTETAPVRSALEDVDGNGTADLILHFRTEATGLMCGDTAATLTGATFAAERIQGSDHLTTVGCRT